MKDFKRALEEAMTFDVGGNGGKKHYSPSEWWVAIWDSVGWSDRVGLEGPVNLEGEDPRRNDRDTMHAIDDILSAKFDMDPMRFDRIFRIGRYLIGVGTFGRDQLAAYVAAPSKSLAERARRALSKIVVGDDEDIEDSNQLVKLVGKVL